MSNHESEPLPRSLLPDATAPASDEALWEDRLQTLMRAAEPALAELRRETPRWWELLAAWWRPAAGLVGAAVAALLIVVATAAPRGERAPGAVALAAAATDGAPAALWTALGSQADPVLAAIALEGGTQ
jgi:hypothetical protein